MRYVDFLLDGKGQSRDIGLALAFWGLFIALCVGLAFAVVPSPPPVPKPIDLLATAELGKVSHLFTKRVEIPSGGYAVFFPGKSKIIRSEKAMGIVVRVPVGPPGAVLCAGVVHSPRVFTIKTPRFTRARKAAFLRGFAKKIEMLRGPFVTRKLLLFRPVIAQGFPGYEAHLLGKGVDKRHVELYVGKRCFKFEIARKGAPLGPDDLACLYSVIASIDDFASLKK